MILEQLENINQFTFQEQAIANYILSNQECILKNNAKELAKLTYTSASTMVRFCKKLGFKGYPDFQVQYIREHVSKKEYHTPSLNKEMGIRDVVEIVDDLYHYVIKETKQMIAEESLVRIMSYMFRAKKIDFYASDINYVRIQCVCLKLNSIGIQAQAFNALNNYYIQNVNPKECLAFVVSHSGNNPSMVEIAYALRKHRIITIALTGKIQQALELICNESLYIFSANDELSTIQYSISLEYLLDVLYTCLLKKSIK